MENSLLNKTAGLLWNLFKLNIYFAVSNAVIIVVLLTIVLHWITLPLYLIGIVLLVPSLQALFLAIKRLDQLAETTLTRLYIRCYKEEFKGSLLFALGYVIAALIILGAYMGLGAVPYQFPLVPFFAVLSAVLYTHFIFGLLIRANLIINIKGTWRLGLYCISKHPLQALLILGSTFAAGVLMSVIHQLIILGIVPLMAWLWTKSTRKMFIGITKVLNIQGNEEVGLIESEDDSK